MSQSGQFKEYLTRMVMDRHTRRKGVFTKRDPTKRIKFAKEFVNRGVNFWREEISFYFDSVGFNHKTRPMEDAMS